MPRFNFNSSPQQPEGEYCGVIQKVSSGYTKANDPRFTFNIRLKDGTVIRDSLTFQPKVFFRVENLCRSAGLEPPENGGGVYLTTDDLEGRLVFFKVTHSQSPDGRGYSNINYHTPEFAISKNPALAGQFPPQAPRKLREAPDEPGNAGSTPATIPTAPPPTTTPAQAVGITEASNEEGMTPAEYAQALAYAQLLQAEKKIPPAG